MSIRLETLIICGHKNLQGLYLPCYIKTEAIDYKVLFLFLKNFKTNFINCCGRLKNSVELLSYRGHYRQYR